mgnify:CR=1 FL=1
MKILRVRAIGDALVQDYQAMRDHVRRYIGRRYDPSVGVNGGWVSTDEVVEVPNIAEYRLEVREGNLEPADPRTAMDCGVQFNYKD